MEQSSYVLNTMARGIAAASDDASAGTAIAKKYGIVSDSGESQTPEAIEERGKARSTNVAKLDGYIEETKKMRESAPAESSLLQDAVDRSTGREFVAAAADATQAVANGGIALANWLDNNMGNRFKDLEPTTFAQDLFPQSPSIINNTIRSVSRFLLPFSAATKVANAVGITGAVTGSITAGAATDFMTREGHEENLSDLVQTLPQFGNPLANTLAEYAKKAASLTAHSKTDDEFTGRLKNAAEGAGLGVLTEGLVKAAALVGNMRWAKSAVKTADELSVRPPTTSAIPPGQKPIPLTPQEATLGQGGKTIYHGTNTEFKEFDFERGGGMAHFTEDAANAQKYARDTGSGGRAGLKYDEMKIVDSSGEVYEYSGKTKDGSDHTWKHKDGTEISLEKDLKPSAERQDGSFTAEPLNPRIIEKSINMPEVLDTYKPGGLQKISDILQVKPEQAPYTQQLINRLKKAAKDELDKAPGAPGFGHTFWSISKLARGDEIKAALKEVTTQLKNSGYKGIRFRDDSHATIAAFDNAFGRRTALPRKPGQPNPDIVSEDTNVRTLIGNIDEKKRALFESSIPRITFDEIKAQPLTALDKILRTDSSVIWDSNIDRHSLTMYAKSASAQASDAAQAILKGDVSDKAMAHWLQTEEMATELWYRDSQQAGKIAQAHGLRNAAIGDDLLPGAEAELIKLHGGKEQIFEDVKTIARLTPEEKNAFREKTLTKAWADALVETRASNLLIKPSTQIKNEGGNHATLLIHNASRALAPYMPTGKLSGWGKDLQKVLSGAGKEPSNEAKGLRAIFAEHSRLTNLTPDVLAKIPFPGREKLAKQIETLDGYIKKAAFSRHMPGEASSAFRGEVETYITQARSALGGFLDTVEIAKQGAKAEGKTLSELAQEFEKNPHNKYDFAPAISSQHLGGGKAMDMFGELQRFPLTVLGKRDNFMKLVNYMGELRRLGTNLAKQQELTGAEYSDFVTNFVKKSPSWAGAINAPRFENLGVAAKRAHRATFTEELDDTFSQGIYKLIHDGEVFGVRVPVNPLKLYAPFVKSNLNIMKYGMDYSPVAPLVGRYQDAIKRGGAEAQMVRAQMAVGTSVMMAATGLAATSGITGYGPNNPKLRKLWMDQGGRPYTVKIAGQDVDLDMLGPIAPVMKIAADFADIAPHAWGDGDVTVDELSELGGMMSWIVANHMSPESLLDSMGSLIEDLKTGDFNKAAAGVASSMVPLSGHAGVINSALDNTKRDTSYDPNSPIWKWAHETINKVKEKIPTLSSSLPAQKNIWGDEVLYPKGVGAQTMSPIFGTRISQEDTVLAEFFRLGDNGVTANEADQGDHFLQLGMPERMLSKSEGGVKGVVQLSPAEYSQFVDLCAGKYESVGVEGVPTLKESLKTLIEGDVYPKLRDEEKRIQIKNIVREYRANAKDIILSKNRDIMQRLEKSFNAGVNKRGFQDGSN